MTAFVDTCVLIDVLDASAKHHQWSVDRLNEAKQEGPVFVSDIVYSEFSVSLTSISEVDQVIHALNLERCSYSSQDLFDAGKAYAAYRGNGGTKLNVLPDFLIGALGVNQSGPIITRDVTRFRTYFPTAALISP